MKSRLILLIFVTLLPVFLVFLYFDMMQKRTLEMDIKKELTSFSLLAKENITSFVETTHKLLITIAHSEQLQTEDYASISNYFAQILKHYPDYANIGLADLNGNIVSSAVPIKKTVNSADLFWFQQALKTKDFSYDDYHLGRVVGQPVIVFSQPILDKDENIKAIVYLSIKLNWLNKFVSNIKLTDGFDFSITDRNGTILSRYPDFEKWLGKKNSALDLISTMINKSDTLFETVGMDNVKRWYALTSVVYRESKIHIAVGKSSQQINEQLYQRLIRDIVLLVIVMGLGFLIAIIVSNVMILKPINVLKRVAQNFAAKNFEIRTHISYKSAEFGILAQTFDNMASDIETYIKEQKSIKNLLIENNKELHAAKEKAEESDKLKTAFLQNISHEIRTPMNAIIGFSKMLDKPELTPEKRKKFTSVIISSANQLLFIISDVLTISSLVTKQEIVSCNKIIINTIIDDLLISFTPQAQKKNIFLYTKKGLIDLESIIYTDSVKLQKVLNNLISNALKFTHEGFVEFGYRQKNDILEFYVKDTGIGIKKESLQKIFEQFSQADFSISQQYGGSGLGLSISKGFVELLGGEIWVESELGKGTTMFFTVPYQT